MGGKNKRLRRINGWFSAGFAVVLLLASPAQTAAGISGFNNDNKNVPVAIDADTLELQEDKQRIIFSGNVDVKQGSLRVQAAELVVYYRDRGGAGDRQILRIEAKGHVVVTQDDQAASGDQAIYDLENGRMTLIGNAVLTQGENVIKGSQVSIDLNSGVTTIGGQKDEGGGRVQALFPAE